MKPSAQEVISKILTDQHTEQPFGYFQHKPSLDVVRENIRISEQLISQIGEKVLRMRGVVSMPGFDYEHIWLRVDCGDQQLTIDPTLPLKFPNIISMLRDDLFGFVDKRAIHAVCIERPFDERVCEVDMPPGIKYQGVPVFGARSLN